MHIKQYILILISLLLLSCQKDSLPFGEDTNDNKPYVVGFWAGGSGSGSTRTAINDDGKSVSWQQGDSVALWALQGNSYTLQNQPFNLWFRTTDNSQAFFTSTLVSAMPAGEYTYYACYPTSVSNNGTTATFTIPSVQDGKMSGGADIMVAQGDGPALEKLYNPEAGDYLIDDGLSLNMRHLIHALRFYVPQSQWGFPENETVERITFTMPSSAVAATGTVTADVASGTAGLTMTNNGSNTVSLNLSEPITPSAASANGGVSFDYAAAAIMPATYTGDLVVKVFSQTKASQVTIANVNREMQAGHITPVGLNCSETIDQYCLRFVYRGNNLGEDVTEIRVKYTDENEASQILTIPGNQFIKDGYYDVDLTDWAPINFSALRSKLNDQVVTVEYESANAVVSNKVKLPDVTQKGLSIVNLVVPYLFFEDFSTVSSFSSDDAYTTSSTGSKSAYSFLNGWTGARIGAEAGTAIRIACRRETSADYPARVDSAPLKGLKDGKTVSLSITFDYGMDRKEGGVGSNPELGQTCYLGYVKNNMGEIKSGSNFYLYGLNDQEGEFFTNFYIKETGASYTNIPHKNYNYTLSGCDKTTRLTWLTTNDHKAGMTNGTFWLYIDNIRVKIVQ